MRWAITIGFLVAVLLAGSAAIVYWAYSRTTPKSPTTAPVARVEKPSPPVAAPAMPPASTPRIQAYTDLIRTLPNMADASISETKLPLEQVAHIRLPFWTYICPRRELWISHPDAPSLDVAPEENARGVHVTREQVVFVHWTRSGRQYRATPICRDDHGAFRVFRHGQDPVKLDRFDYHWTDAVSVDDAIAVPTDLGISVIRMGGDIREDYKPLTQQSDVAPMIELTPSGFVAWVPAALPTDKPASVAWFSKGQWTPLPEPDWQGDFVHLVPFADGSVLQIRPTATGTVDLRITALETIPADAAKIKELVRLLGDDDPEVRDNAHSQLVALGPAAWGLLDQLKAAQQGEAAVRIGEIVASRTRPKLGRFELIDGMLRPIWRLRDGTVFLADAGVNPGAEQAPVVPAWICIRRGQPITLLPPTLARFLAVGDTELACAAGEWIVSDPGEGARLFFGQELMPLNNAKDKQFRRVAGIDRNARVLLRPTDAKPYSGEFLLIDPAIGDPTPLLQIWTMRVEEGVAGWTADDYPAVKRGGGYFLKEDSWEPLKTEPITRMPAPATQPGTIGVLKRLSGESGGWTVWTSPTEVVLQNANGQRVYCPRPAGLPKDDIGGAVANGRIYLVHPNRKLSRLRMAPGTSKPVSVDAIFEQQVPAIGDANRVWIDPAGRLCIVSSEGQLVVIFLSGRIPPAMLDMIPADELKQARPKD